MAVLLWSNASATMDMLDLREDLVKKFFALTYQLPIMEDLILLEIKSGTPLLLHVPMVMLLREDQPHAPVKIWETGTERLPTVHVSDFHY